MHITTFDFHETAGIDREREPVTWGVPLPEGLVRDTRHIVLTDQAGIQVPLAATLLAKWPDGSFKWLLCDMQVTLKKNCQLQLELRRFPESERVIVDDCQADLGLTWAQAKDELKVNTGCCEFYIDTRIFKPFRQCVRDGFDCLEQTFSRTVLQDNDGTFWEPVIEAWNIEAENRLRLVVHFAGSFRGNEEAGMRFAARIHFYAGKSFSRIDFTIHNPQAAKHTGGLWDLGDPGSMYFEDLSLEVGLNRESSGIDTILYPEGAGQSLHSTQNSLSVYQDSSGGENWKSKNHVNRQGRVPISFRGYQVWEDDQVLQEGERATPVLAATNNRVRFWGTIRHFWENFPKALEYKTDLARFRLFPAYFGDCFELQAGEQKTHTLYMGFEDAGQEIINPLGWVHEPLIPIISPEWYAKTRALPHLAPLDTRTGVDGKHSFAIKGGAEACQTRQELLRTAVQGEKSFFVRREMIDEYGWRHFGDLYADHEAVFHHESSPFISHYNNQYDVIKGAVQQFCSTANAQWLRLAQDLADHVADIDIYHTDEDRYQFNQGMFWHTDHHLEAATASHRASSAQHCKIKNAAMVGSGPSYSNIYATGFAYLYWLTGEMRYKESVLKLVQNIIAGLSGPDTFSEAGYQALKTVHTQIKKKLGRAHDYETVYGLDGPGRASGNALNVLLDAFVLMNDQFYLNWAETLIAKCVSPDDDIASRDLLNAELRWMYTVFLKALCRYLEIKGEIGQHDQWQEYAKAVLLNYGRWMLENESAYLDKPEILEFPNETWAAQEFRKSDILAFVATLVSGELQDRFLGKGMFFFQTGLEHLNRYENKILTRPLALVMTNGMEFADIYMQWRTGDLPAESPSNDHNWKNKGHGQPKIRMARLGSLLISISPAKEWRWVRARLSNRYGV